MYNLYVFQLWLWLPYDWVSKDHQEHSKSTLKVKFILKIKKWKWNWCVLPNQFWNRTCVHGHHNQTQFSLDLPIAKKGYTIRSLGKPQRTQAMSTLTQSKPLFFILQLHHHTILPVFAKLMTFGSVRELPHRNPNPDVAESHPFNSFNPTTSPWFGLASI